MTAYRFTRSAREDLIDIWLYTQETWGEAQADVYQDALHLCCERIAAGWAQPNPCQGSMESCRILVSTTTCSSSSGTQPSSSWPCFTSE